MFKIAISTDLKVRRKEACKVSGHKISIFTFCHCLYCVLKRVHFSDQEANVLKPLTHFAKMTKV